MSLTQEIERALSAGPKRAKEIVEEVSRVTGKKEATVFYWLKKLQETGRIAKVNEKYVLKRSQRASGEEISFLLAKLKGGNRDEVGEAKKDFWCLCLTKTVGHHPKVQEFLEEAIGGCYGEELRKWGLNVLIPIANRAVTMGEKEVLGWLLNLKQLRELVLDARQDEDLRDGAGAVLDKILEGREHFDFFFGLLEKLLREERAREYRPLLERIWDYLLRKHFPERKTEIRERLYALLGQKEYAAVKERIVGFLGSLRDKEYETLKPESPTPTTYL